MVLTMHAPIGTFTLTLYDDNTWKTDDQNSAILSPTSGSWAQEAEATDINVGSQNIALTTKVSFLSTRPGQTGYFLWLDGVQGDYTVESIGTA